MSERRNLTEAIRRGEEERHRLIEDRLRKRAEREQAELDRINQLPRPVQLVVSAPAQEPAVPVPAVEQTNSSEISTVKTPHDLGAQTPKIGRPIGRPDAQNWAPNAEIDPSLFLGAQSSPNWAPNDDAVPDDRPAKWSVRHGEPYFPSRQLKGRIHLRLPVTMLEALEQYCERFQCDRQAVVEEALSHFLGAQNRKIGRPTGEKIGRPKNWAPNHDDHDDDDNNKIIIIYEQMTGNKATARDRLAAQELLHLNAETIRHGIALTISRARSKINSLRYCFGAIREVAGTGTEPAVPRPAQPPTPTGFADCASNDLEAWPESKTEFRLIAARLREIHLGEQDYTRERLRDDLKTTLIAMGRDVDDRQIDDALGIPTTV